jgi:hypothetical protein
MTPEARQAQRQKELEEQARRELEEQQRQQGKQPSGAQRNPNDPTQPASKDGTPPPSSQDPKVDPWFASLPPELREFWAGGGLEKLPPRLRKIVEDYQRSLDRQTRPSETPAR